MKSTYLPKDIRVFTVGDLILIAIFMGSVFYSIPFIHQRQPSTVAIYRDNAVYAKYSLNENRIVPVNGYEGNIVVSIENTKVFISSSCCKRQICVRSAPISKPFQQLVCVPNHILIEIQSTDRTNKFDAIAK